MTDNERMIKVATATPIEKAKIDAIFNHTDGDGKKPEADTRTVTYTEAAKRLGLSRPTVYRLTRAGRLRTVKLCGVSRIVLSSVVDFVNCKGNVQ